MKFPQPLVPGRLVRRYKRFLADIAIGGDADPVLAHCANPGSMWGVCEPGLDVWLSRNTNPKAKLDWRWELVRADGAMIGINTALPNQLAEEALKAGTIPELQGYDSIRREVRYGRNSRIDILLRADGRPPCYVEVKNVHMRRIGGAHPGAAEFPDAATVRGAKHLDELADAVAAGARAVMLYIVQRGDCDHFRVAADIDPRYMAGLHRAVACGVEAIAYCCNVTTEGIELDRTLPVVLD